MSNSKRLIARHSPHLGATLLSQAAVHAGYDFDYSAVKNPQVGGIKINIETWADTDKNTFKCWGDYWVKAKLQEALRLGYNCDCEVPTDKVDATIYLWGSNFEPRRKWPFGYNPRKGLNMLWFYSHPDNMTQKELSKYPVVFCLSKPYIPVMQKKYKHNGIMPDPLLSCTDFAPPVPIPNNDLSEVLKTKERENQYRADITFVGNARGALPWGRQAISWLEPPTGAKVQVYGAKWEQAEYEKYIKTWYAGQYWPYENLNQLYFDSRIVLIDGHEDMNREGFVPMKLFDTLASGAFPLMVYNSGVADIFGDSVEMYRTKEEMNTKIQTYLQHPELRLGKILQGYQIAKQHTYQKRAEIFYHTILSKL